MKRGFTLLEVITCIAIIVIVAAISFPAFQNAKRAATIQSASSNLHQLYLAIAIYRTDMGGDAVYGSAASMGLPTTEGTFPTPIQIFLNKYKPFWKSPCGLNSSWYVPYSWEPAGGPLVDIIYRPADSRTFADYATRYRENTLLFYDINCDDPGNPINNPYVQHRGLAVLVEGRLINRYKEGLMLNNDSWWSSPVGN